MDIKFPLYFFLFLKIEGNICFSIIWNFNSFQDFIYLELQLQLGLELLSLSDKVIKHDVM